MDTLHAGIAGMINFRLRFRCATLVFYKPFIMIEVILSLLGKGTACGERFKETYLFFLFLFFFNWFTGIIFLLTSHYSPRSVIGSLCNRIELISCFIFGKHTFLLLLTLQPATLSE